MKFKILKEHKKDLRIFNYDVGIERYHTQSSVLLYLLMRVSGYSNHW